MKKDDIIRILTITILTLIMAVIGGYAVFTSGNGPIVLKEDPAIFYFVLGTYILSVILSWFGLTLNEIRWLSKEKN